MLRQKLICNGIANVEYGEKKMKWLTTSGCSKLAHKEYKTKHDWMGKVIPLGIVPEIDI